MQGGQGGPAAVSLRGPADPTLPRATSAADAHLDCQQLRVCSFSSRALC